jgi:signal transduction histidine kinase
MYPRHRWAVVIGSILFIGAVEVLSDSVLDPLLSFPLDTILVMATVATLACVAAWYAFRLIDRLMDDVWRRHQELLHRNASLRAVYDVSLALVGQHDPDEVLESIVDHARRLLRADAALLVIADSHGRDHLRTSCAGPGVMAAREANDGHNKPGSEEPAGLARFLAAGYRIGLEAAVCEEKAGSGSLAVAVAQPREFSRLDNETLSALATQAGLALEAARLRDEMDALAVQRERERIAREMHDGLAQVLGYVNTKSQAVEELLSRGRVEDAAKQMQQLATASRNMYVDVREAILSLSPPVLPERGLSRALEEYAAQFAESSKIAVRFHATPDASRSRLKPQVSAEVFGVAREALTNVRKHAHANRVSIDLTTDPEGELRLRIADDGVGFDAEAMAAGPEKWPHFGIAGMRERAESIGARIAWQSRSGQPGSVVELLVPTFSGGASGPNSDVGPPGGAASRTMQHQMVQSTTPTHSEAD